MRRSVLDTGKRMDGRACDEIRPIWCEVNPLPMPHGSAYFQRGETLALATCTLGTKLDEKMVDNVLDKSYQRFLLHYNFPPFCTGEAKAQRGVGRREIGHGHLAWRGLKGMIPEDFPYTVRLVSQVLESNGSSSMATVCSGTLALMDAGVPIKKPVSGIVSVILSRIYSRACFACISAFSRISNESPSHFISICVAVIPSRVPVVLKSMSPKWSSSPRISLSTAYFSSPGFFIKPIAIPERPRTHR